LSAKFQLVFNKMLRQESSSFSKWLDSLNGSEERYSSLKSSVDEFAIAYDSQGFDPLIYVSSHRELLSYEIDSYLITQLLIARENITKEEHEDLVNAVWQLREVLAFSREKIK